MRTGRIAVLLAAVLLLGTALPGAAAPPAVAFAGSGVIRGDLGAFRGAPVAAAGKALAAVADRLGVDADAFALDQVRRSRVGVHVRGTEVRDGVPVEGTSAAVHAVNGRVVQVEARDVALPGRPVAQPVSQTAATAAALGRLSVTETLREPVARRLLTADGNRLVDVWRISVLAAAPAVAAEVDVSAATGRVLKVRDARVLADGTATVFDPNPIVSKQDASLRQPLAEESAGEADLDSPELTAELTVLPIPEYDPAQIAAGRLVGPWASVQGPGPLVSVPGAATFSFTRSDPRFETTMAYAHIDRAQRYFQQLGFVGDAGVNAEPQDAYALPVMGYDQSFYMPAQDLLLFGAGGVDDGEDAEVILHEYGHAVHDAQVPGWGSRHEGGAMGEGFGDFLAAAFYGREISGGFGDVCIMDWDATSYSDDDPPCLRRVDSTKQYPQDMTGDSVHADGELWSSFLWRLRSQLGENSVEQSDNVITLVLTSHEFLTPTAEFGDAVAALRQAAVALGQTEWPQIIDATANETGMPLNP